MPRQDKPKDFWDKLQIVAIAFASLAVPIVVAVVANNHNQSIQESQNETKLFEIAISILREKPKNETSALRSWAIQYFASQTKTNVPLPAEATDELKNEVPYTYIDHFGTAYRYSDNYVGGTYSDYHAANPKDGGAVVDCTESRKLPESSTSAKAAARSQEELKPSADKAKNEP